MTAMSGRIKTHLRALLSSYLLKWAFQLGHPAMSLDTVVAFERFIESSKRDLRQL
jgi:hypothetical protein